MPRTRLCCGSSLPAEERVAAIKATLPRDELQQVLAEVGANDARCSRLPGWFLVWFVVAQALFSRDSYRQVYRWLTSYRKNGTPPRSTLCMARQRLGVGPLRKVFLAVVRLLATKSTRGRSTVDCD